MKKKQGKRTLRNWAVRTAWKLGLMEVPWWDDARIEREDAVERATIGGEALRAALGAAARAGRWGGDAC